MILNDISIDDLSIHHELISPYDPNNLQPCSYDVTLSKSIIRYIGSGEINASDKSLRDLEYFKFIIPDEGYILEPGEFILGSTNESVNIPSDLAARYEGKSSMGRIGLATHITAGFIDPGFSGDITLEIKNENNHPIRIFPGMRIGQLCFFELTGAVARVYGSANLGSHYQNQSGPTPSSNI